jgi:hypothetical protein
VPVTAASRLGAAASLAVVLFGKLTWARAAFDGLSAGFTTSRASRSFSFVDQHTVRSNNSCGVVRIAGDHATCFIKRVDQLSNLRRSASKLHVPVTRSVLPSHWFTRLVYLEPCAALKGVAQDTPDGPSYFVLGRYFRTVVAWARQIFTDSAETPCRGAVVLQWAKLLHG